MSRGRLDKEIAARVESQLPDVNSLRRTSLELQPDFISLGFPPNSTIPIAVPCLQDMTSTLSAVRYAVLESIAHLIWYREKVEPPNEYLAVFFGCFYADDAALRLYTAREHLTEAIICMLELSKQDLKEFRRIVQPPLDKLSLPGKGLKMKVPDNPIADTICNLVESEEWFKTMMYRNQWVHGKPPIIKGMGIGYERRNRLKVTDKGVGISFGGGDAPHYSVDDLLSFIRPALILFTDAASMIVQYYIELLNQKQKSVF